MLLMIVAKMVIDIVRTHNFGRCLLVAARQMKAVVNFNFRLSQVTDYKSLIRIKFFYSYCEKVVSLHRISAMGY